MCISDTILNNPVWSAYMIESVIVIYLSATTPQYPNARKFRKEKKRKQRKDERSLYSNGVPIVPHYGIKDVAAPVPLVTCGTEMGASDAKIWVRS